MRTIIATALLFALAMPSSADETDEVSAACAAAFKVLIKVDKSYEKMQRVSCNSAMGHSKKYWVCVKEKVEAGEAPKVTAQNCPEE